MIGKTVAHYKILEKIGEGSMGVVKKKELGQIARRDDRIALRKF